MNRQLIRRQNRYFFERLEDRRMLALSLGWAAQLGSTSKDQANSVAVDDLGNVYVGGTFGGTVDFDPGAGVANLTSAGSDDVFVTKFAADGTYLWARRWGRSGTESLSALKVDSQGNVYTVGAVQIGTIDFDPGPGTFNLTSAGNSAYVSKLDTNGNFVWACLANSSDSSTSSAKMATALAVDHSGNLLITGQFPGTVDFDPGAGVANLTSSNSTDIFVWKLTTSGQYVSARCAGGLLLDIGNGIAVDSTDNIYVTGTFGNIVDFDPGAGTFNMNAGSFDDGFVWKLDASGNFVWVQQLASTDSFTATDVEIDSADNVLVTGGFYNTVDFDPGAGTYQLTSTGNYDVFVVQLTSAGNFNWARAVGGVGQDLGARLAFDSQDNVVVVGQHCQSADFDPGPSTFVLPGGLGLTQPDAFVVRLTNSGNLIDAWSTVVAGFTSGNVATAIAVAPSGDMYVSGFFSNTADFDTGPGVFNLTAPGSTGVTDAFVAKLLPPVKGDIDRNGSRTADDIPALLSALTDLKKYRTTQLLTAPELLDIADINGDAVVNNCDIQATLDLLISDQSAGQSGGTGANGEQAELAGPFAPSGVCDDISTSQPAANVHSARRAAPSASAFAIVSPADHGGLNRRSNAVLAGASSNSRRVEVRSALVDQALISTPTFRGRRFHWATDPSAGGVESFELEPSHCWHFAVLRP